MKQALVLMTALLPTTGHRDLIAFAAQLPHTQVHVMVNSRSDEPLATDLRVEALSEVTPWPNVTIHGCLDDAAPQNPDEHPDFWHWWKDSIAEFIPDVTQWDYVVASESYGEPMAATLGARFLPYDVERVLNPTKSTPVRLDVEGQWESILPAAQRELTLKAVFFGQESVGKSTLSKLIAEELHGAWHFEYYRPYAELTNAGVDDDAMADTHLGQRALQASSHWAAKLPYLIYDTDLYSTIGYWGILGKEPPTALVEDAEAFRGDVYYLLPDDVPFEADPLRFGGDARESTYAYWLRLIVSYQLPYVAVPRGTLEEKKTFILADIKKRSSRQWAALESYQRT